MSSVLEDLDDPVPLPPAGPEHRQAVIRRGESLLRRRRALGIGIPAAAAVVAAVAASTALSLTTGPGPSPGELLVPAAPPSPLLVLDEAAETTEPAYAECLDPVGDSVGRPDVTLFSLDRPHVPLVHYHWETGTLPFTGVVELLFEATSADGERSRQLVARADGGRIVEQFLHEPMTGARLDVPRTTETFDGRSLGASFPQGALSGLGDRWTWVGSLSIDGTVVDWCDESQDVRGPVPPGGRG